jgi:hypothetical protein
MKTRSGPLERIKGRTIKDAAFTITEASDGCLFGSFDLHFTDGSSLHFSMRNDPVFHAQFFKDDTDEGAEPEVRLGSRTRN